MKHRSSRILFEHWHERRGSRALPERSAIDPGAIRAGLGDIFILAFNRREGHPFRLAGTRVSALAGGDLKDRSFVSLWEPAQQAEIVRVADLIADESIGIVAGVAARAEEDLVLDLELLLLPLRHWGRTHVRLIGALAPLSLPDWFGTRSVGPLVLGDYRYVGLRAADRFPVASALLRRDAKVRRGLIVYDGGRR
ncbi:MAG TPA: PAS domain-containing protein [Xanthobacteraceae bacterium]|nr:PAS domain-containing protein [Xanthobacteraceae bacterium]